MASLDARKALNWLIIEKRDKGLDCEAPLQEGVPFDPLATGGIEPPLSSALWRRRTVLRLLLIALLAEIGYAVLNISTMPLYLAKDRGYGTHVIGIVVTAFLLSEALLKGPMGHLADRYGRRRLMVIGPALTIFTALATVAVPHNIGALETVILIFLRVLDGVGAAMLWPAAFAQVGETVADNERQEAMSLLNSCYLLGIALALPIGGIFNDLLGRFFASTTGARSPSLFLAAALFAAVAICAYRFVPSGRDHRAAQARPQPAATCDEEHVELKTVLDSAKRIPQFLLLGLVTFCGIGFPMIVVKVFAWDQFKMSESQFGFLAMPGALVMAALSVPMSKLGERIGRSKAVHWGLGLCTCGLAVISLGAFMEFFRSAWFLALGGIPLGVGFLLAIPAWYASVSEANPQRRAANIGAVMTAQGLGAIIGAPLGGLFYEKFQAWGVEFGRYSPFLGCAICVGLGWALSLRVLSHQPIQQA